MKAERSMINSSELDGERLLLCPVHVSTFINEVAIDKSIIKAELSPLENLEKPQRGIEIKTSKCQVTGCHKEISWALWLYRPLQTFLSF